MFMEHTGNLIVRFPGQWFIMDAQTKIIVNDLLHSTHSFINGFSATIPITSDRLTLKVVIGGLRSTTYELNGLERGKDYVMELLYSTTWGKFSKEYRLSEQQATTTQAKNKKPNYYLVLISLALVLLSLATGFGNTAFLFFVTIVTAIFVAIRREKWGKKQTINNSITKPTNDDYKKRTLLPIEEKNNDNQVDELNKFFELKEKGAITEEEYNAKKRQLLNQ